MLKSKKSGKNKKSSPKKKSKLKLIKIVKSPIKTKKLRAYFNDNTHTDFGANGYKDFILFKGNLNKKKSYIRRHSKRENWNDPKSPGALSRWILWNKPKLRESIKNYKKKFNL